MRIFGFGDSTDYRLRIHPGHDGRYYVEFTDRFGVSLFVQAVHGRVHGWATYEEAETSARRFCRGVGIEFDDLTLVDE